jgi:hypothetical protein
MLSLLTSLAVGLQLGFLQTRRAFLYGMRAGLLVPMALTNL